MGCNISKYDITDTLKTLYANKWKILTGLATGLIIKIGLNRFIMLTVIIAMHTMPLVGIYLLYKFYKEVEYPYNIIGLPLLYYLMICEIPIPDKWRTFISLLGNSEPIGFNTINVMENNITDLDTIKNTLYLLVPHGPSSIIPGYMASYFAGFGTHVQNFVASNLVYAPFFRPIMSLFFKVSTVDQHTIVSSLIENQLPSILYPGGISEMLLNASNPNILQVKLNPDSRLYDMAKEAGRNIAPLVILNEQKYIGHNQYVVKFFQMINKYVLKCGIPFAFMGYNRNVPLIPASEPIQMVMGDLINTDGLSSGEIYQKLIENVKQILVRYGVEHVIHA